MQKFQSNSGAEIVRKILVFFLYALLATPMLLSSRFFFPYISTKTFYFRLIVELAFGLYLVLAVADSRYRPRFSALHWAVFLYAAIAFFAAVFGANFYRSFWGNAERGEGLLTFLHVVMLFVILAGVFRTQRSWERYFTAAVIVGLITAVYATLQKFCGNPAAAKEVTDFTRFCQKNIVSGDVSRISALIGNAAFFAGYLVTNIYIALWLSLRRGRQYWVRIFFWAVIIYEIIIVNYTRTRGAILGLAIGIAVMMVIAVLTSRRSSIRYGAAGALLLLVISGALLYKFRDTPFVLKAGGLHNVTHISRNDITTESRLLTWQASLKGWQDRFWQGYGYENFSVAFNKYFPAKIFRDSGSQIWFDRAHSIFFDVSLSNGIFGILTYLSFFAISLWMLWRYYLRDRENNRLILTVFVGFLVSYFLQNLFVFDTMGTYIAFYSILAFLVYLSFAPSQNDKIKPQRFAVKPVNPLLITILLIVLIPTLYFTTLKPAQANMRITQALYASATGKLQETLDIYREVLNMNTYMNEEARQKLAEAAIGLRDNQNFSNEAKVRAFRMAIDEMKIAIARAPMDARNYLYLMTLYNTDPEPEDGLRREAINQGKKALELSPTRPQIYFEMGQAAFNLRQNEEGVGYFEKALELNTDATESHWNLALAYAVAGRFDDAKKQVDHVLNTVNGIEKINDSGIRSMIAFMSNAGRVDDTFKLYDVLLERNPSDSQTMVNLALTYGKTCRINEARSFLEQAGKLDQKVASNTPAYLQQLQAQCAGR